MLRALHRNSSKGNYHKLVRWYSATPEPFASTTLSNGIKVAVNPSPGHFSALGLFVDAGSRYESVKEQGVSHLVDRLAFKSTQNIPGTKMLETLELLGGNSMCASSRETMMYQASVFNKDVDKMFGLLAETVKCPLITEAEVQEQKATARYEIDEIWLKPNLILPELFHTTAYSSLTLGSPLLCPAENLDSINRDMIIGYRERLYQPQSIVAAFVGVPLETAVQYTENYLGDMLQKTPKVQPTTAKYTGGELSLPSFPPMGGQENLVHLYIGFEGLSIDDPDIYALSTLQTLLGGGGSFSAGGPGKGMYSRLYTQVLNQYHYIENCQSFIHSYADSGLFGISASSIPEAAPYLSHIISRQLAELFSDGEGKSNQLNDREVKRAKNQLRSSLLMNLESKMIELEDIGRQVQFRGHRIPVQEMVSKIESLTTDDLKRVARRVLTGQADNPGQGSGEPTVVVQGDRNSFGDIQRIIKSYGLGKN